MSGVPDPLLPRYYKRKKQSAYARLAEDGILPIKDLLGSGNSSFSLTGQKYFKINTMQKRWLSSYMFTQYFHTDSHASCTNFEGLFGGVKLWKIHCNSQTFSPPKFCTIWY